MIHTTFRRGLALGVLVGAVVAVVRTVQGRRPTPTAAPTWDPIPNSSPVLVPEPDLDVHVAPGPATQPSRSAAPKATKPTATAKKPTAKKPTAKKSKATASRDAVNALQETPAPTPESEVLAPWVEPAMGECPTTHPVKGKLSSRIFHVPGGFNYPRTKADRCYLDAAAAEADGLRRSKR